MKRKNILLAALAFALVLTAAVGSAMAYFTTNAEAKGGCAIELGGKTTVKEEFSNWTKHVSIQSEPDSEPVYLRVKAFCGSEYELIYSDGSGKWTPGSDGYYYYSDIVNAGETASTLDIRIGQVPVEVRDADSFNVVVIYERTPVQYQEDGSPYADWSIQLDSGTAEGGVEE